MTILQIAEAFSTGQFDKVIPYMCDHITWEVVGESTFAGKEAVAQNCEQTAAYFKSVTTDFKTENVALGDQCVIINGTAEFSRDGKRIAFVSACDVYNFNEENLLQKISSYCIEYKA